MKAKSLWTLALFVMAGTVWADNLPTVTPTVTPTATATFTPRPTNTPLTAPTWAPESAGPVPDQMKAKKPSPWMSSAGLGVGIPRSPHLGNAYSAGFVADLGSGLKLNDSFSLWLDLSLDLFNAQSNNTNGNNFTMIEAAFWAKYRVLDSDISPYLFLGPGLSYNEYRSNQGAEVDYYTGYTYIPVSRYEVDLIGEGGLGLDMRVGGGITTFIQGKLTYDFTSAGFANFGSTDSPIIVMPLELGLIFGI